MSERPRVAVLGSVNTDIAVRVPHLPGPGETVLGPAAQISPGGKGANQAVAAARLGARVRMCGCRGDDAFGRGLHAALAAEGIDCGGLRVAEGAVSGLALIAVDEAGENAITVAQGANALVGAVDVESALAGPPDVLVLSAEVPRAALAAALAAARDFRLRTVLNLAPAPAEAGGLLAPGVDWLVVNGPEAAEVLGWDLVGASEGRDAARALAQAGARHAVITLGRAGAVLAWDGEVVEAPAFPVRAVDTVGAGDAFVGALAVAAGAGAAPVEAVRAACAAGAAATTRPGAQAGLPTPAEVEAATGLAWPGRG